jgi:hypothetical protein
MSAPDAADVDDDDVDPERERTDLDRLLVGQDWNLARFYLRLVVALALGQGLFTTVLWQLRGFGLPVQSLLAFATTLVLVGLLAAAYSSYRNGGVLVSLALTVAPLVGAVPVAVVAGVEGLTGQALVVGGFGIWAGGIAYLIGRGLRRLRERVGEE